MPSRFERAIDNHQAQELVLFVGPQKVSSVEDDRSPMLDEGTDTVLAGTVPIPGWGINVYGSMRQVSVLDRVQCVDVL